MQLSPEHVVKLAGSALLGGVNAKDFREMLDVLLAYDLGESDAQKKPANTLRHGILTIHGKEMTVKGRVRQLVGALAKNGGVMTIPEIAKAMGDAPESTVFPTVASAREVLASAGFDGKEVIITIPGIRGTDTNASYRWSPDVPVDVED